MAKTTPQAPLTVLPVTQARAKQCCLMFSIPVRLEEEGAAAAAEKGLRIHTEEQTLEKC